MRFFSLTPKYEFRAYTTTTTDKWLQPLAARGQPIHARSSFSLIYLNSLSLNTPKKFLFLLNLSLLNSFTPLRDDLVLFGLRRLANKDYLWQSIILHPQSISKPFQPFSHYSHWKWNWTTFFVVFTAWNTVNQSLTQNDQYAISLESI